MKKILIVLLLIPSIHFGQILKGTVKDSITNENLQLANITFLRSNNGTNTDLNGNYVLNIKQIDFHHHWA